MIVIIPARGGSKGVPGKNIRKLKGKPLIHYTIEVARELFEDRNIILSTDSEAIRQEAIKTGLDVPFLRPAELASDNSGMHEVLIHAVEQMDKKDVEETHQTLLLLQPTSPFRTAAHIKEALEIFHQGLDMVLSVKETKSNPYYLLKEENEEGYLVSSKEGNFGRRQDCPRVWEINGAIYVINIASLKQKKMVEFKKVKKYVMDDFSSHDIDSELDWDIAETLANRKQEY